MMLDTEYARSFFDVWYDGMLDMKNLSAHGMAANNGFVVSVDWKIKEVKK